MKNHVFRVGGIILLIAAILFVGMFASFGVGLAYSRNLNRTEKTMHPRQQTDTVWISAEEDLYLINDSGTLYAFVFWQGAWQRVEFLITGARFQTILLDNKPLLRGNFSMKQDAELRLRCSDDSPWEEAFANGRKRLVLQCYDLDEQLNKLPFLYPAQ